MDLIWMPPYFFRVTRLNDYADKPSPVRSAFTCGLFSDNSRTLSMFSSVTKDRLLPDFPLFLFRLVPKLWYFATLHWMVLLQGASRLNCKLNCCWTWFMLLLSISFPNINFRSSDVNWDLFFFYWLVSRTSSFILKAKGIKFDPW